MEVDPMLGALYECMLCAWTTDGPCMMINKTKHLSGETDDIGQLCKCLV